MTLQTVINKEIADAKTLLDLCAGPGNWTRNTKAVKSAVELNSKYVIPLRNNGYSNIYLEDVAIFNYNDDYDVIIWIDGIEHLDRIDALKALSEAEQHTKKLLVFTPNEFINNKQNAEKLGEPLQMHKSVFPESFWLDRGYKVIYREYNSHEKVNNVLYKKVFQ